MHFTNHHFDVPVKGQTPSILALALGLVLINLTSAAEDFFDTNRVMEIQVEMAPSDWQVLRYQHRESEFFPEDDGKAVTNAYTWFPATVNIDGHRFRQAKVRKKGYIGSNDTKRPALKIQIETSGTSDPKAPPTELTLNNNKQDASLIRQSLAYEVFRRAGVPAPRCNFARVGVNGVSLGVFTHVEEIKRPFLKRNFGRDDGQLYEGGRSDFRSGWFQNFVVKSGGQGSPRADLEAATKALEEPGRPLIPVLSRYVDLEEFLRFWAVESLINDADGYAANANNFYLYHNPVTDKFSFIPWGEDTVLHSGRSGDGPSSGPKSVIAVGILAHRLYTSAEGCERYRATLRQVLNDAWTEEVLLKEVDRLQTLLAPLATDQFTPALEALRGFIKTRRSEIVPELAAPPPPLKSKPLDLAKRRNVGHLEASFSAAWGKLDHPTPIGHGTGSVSGTLYGKSVRLTKVGTQAGVMDGPTGGDLEPGITIGGMDADGQRGWVIYLAIDPESYISGTAIPVDNTHVFGGLLAMNAEGQITKMLGMLRGSLRLRKASREPEGTVEGDVSIDLFSKLATP